MITLNLNPELEKTIQEEANLKGLSIEQYLKDEDIEYIASIPYDESFTKAMIDGQTIIEYDNSNLTPLLTESWDKIKKL